MPGSVAKSHVEDILGCPDDEMGLCSRLEPETFPQQELNRSLGRNTVETHRYAGFLFRSGLGKRHHDVDRTNGTPSGRPAQRRRPTEKL